VRESSLEVEEFLKTNHKTFFSAFTLKISLNQKLKTNSFVKIAATIVPLMEGTNNPHKEKVEASYKHQLNAYKTLLAPRYVFVHLFALLVFVNTCIYFKSSIKKLCSK